MKKLFMLTLAMCLLFSMSFTTFVKAIEQNAYTEQIEILGEKMTVSSSVTDNLVVYESTSEKGEKNVFVYDREKKTATLNGEDINLKFEQYIEHGLDESQLQRSSDPYTPVYVITQNISFDDVINSVGAITTVIGGVIAVASLTGLTLPSIATVISDWAGAVGLGSLAAGYFFSGSFSYKLYRTKDPVQFGVAAWPQIAYRYQDSEVNFTVKQKTMYHSYNKIGSWWYGSKPI